MDTACWISGCLNFTASLIFSTIGFHKKNLEPDARRAIERAVNVHQVASVGFLVLAYQGGPMIPSVMLFGATCLFPYVIYFEKLAGFDTPFKRFVPFGGLMHMVFWITMAFYFTPREQFLAKQEE